ncbi:CocE/NonD family hydrolase [Oscillatoria sp. FACHB-1406]|nr:CocE/NonD family hydrolase [Oscillatoria sp. FACHB-1406]
MKTRDGVRLDADIYRPDSNERFPVLLMRQPYGRAIASTVVYAHPQWYASQGYIVVVQDVRGRGTSEGEFELFAREVEDGFDSVEWAAQLPGSTGEVGMYGFSYQGMTQLYAAQAKSQALKVLCPSMVAYNLYSDWAYENGSFCWQANLGWAVQLAAETARLKGDLTAFKTLYLASRNLPLYDFSPPFDECLRRYAPGNFFYEWLNHSTEDEYWQNLSPNLEGVDLPMLHIGGWFDPYLRGTLNLYRSRLASANPQSLIIGPWAHLPWGRKLGEIDYGETAQSAIDRLQLRWFDYFLKGIDTGLLNDPSVCLFEMGSNQWRYFEEFPQPEFKLYGFASDGLASIREDGGSLVELQADSSTKKGESCEDILVRDPWRPVPALGGHAMSPAGSFERSALDCRSDILTYTSAPLTAELQIVGEVWVEVDCVADAPSFDLCAVLSEVRQPGSVYNVTQGYLRCDRAPQMRHTLKIPLQATCAKIEPGCCLRLSLSADCFPAYALNPGTGTEAKVANFLEAKIITIRVRSGQDSLSCLRLPIYHP